MSIEGIVCILRGETRMDMRAYKKMLDELDIALVGARANFGAAFNRKDEGDQAGSKRCEADGDASLKRAQEIFERLKEAARRR
jgi:hypothetical protein